MPPALQAVAELALRFLRTESARSSLSRAADAADRARVPALLAAIADASGVLERPAARRVQAGLEQTLRMEEVEALLASGALVIDACRRGLRVGDLSRPLARRPVLFAIARALAEAWPAEATRNGMIAQAFCTQRPEASHRACLQLETHATRPRRGSAEIHHGMGAPP